VVDVADPGITLAATATATERIRLGPMVTPLARRRPVKVARETATLDRLSGGRLTLGVGLGSDEFGSEFSIAGEELDDRRRASMLDESLEILAAAWSGEPVHHRSEHDTVDGMGRRHALPAPAGPAARRTGVGRGLLRQAQASAAGGAAPGFLPHRAGPRRTARRDRRRPRGAAQGGWQGPMEPYDVVFALPPGSDPAPYVAAGATWWLVEFPWDAVSVDQVRAVIRDGPAPA
jgi:alkanesulfonate monooxygenase SsuD/methylene tetrahydromethanopterin reductase-like flavin-dependent oxidoreductase (luciferase family)